MKRAFIILLSLVVTTACDEDFFEPKYDNERTLEQTVSDPDRVEGLLMRAYQLMPGSADYYGGFLDCATQNAVTNNFTNRLNKTLEDRWEKNDNPLDINAWRNGYSAIQAVHNFMVYGIESDFEFWKSTDPNDSVNLKLRNRLEGEAYFLRGYYYFDLLKRFAGKDESGNLMGVPLILTLQDANDYTLPERATFTEVVDQIEVDLTKAAELLPDEYEAGDDLVLGFNINYGRATRLASLALLSRVYLYAGSPLYNDGSYEVSYMQKSVDAAAEVIEYMGSGLPDIYTGNGQSFYTNSDNGEVIMSKLNGLNRNIESREFPPSYLGGGSTNPTQNLVDAFPLANGYPVNDPNSGYDPNTPYGSRNPRFAATILYDGQFFKGSTIETFEGGKDTPGGSSASTANNSTRTGYYLRKWVSSEADLVSNVNSRHYFPILRKGELLLNYAEAALEGFGPNADPAGIGLTAFQAITEVRRRAGIVNDEYLALAANDPFTIREVIRNERRVELCFEGHFFYDIRRWDNDLDALNEPVKRMTITRDGLGNKNYQVETMFTPQFEAHMKFGPMPFEETLKTSTISQNQGW